MIARRGEVKDLGAEVVLVAYDQVSLLQAKMMHDLTLPYPLLLDVEKRAYARWGLGRTSLGRSMFSPSLNFRYLKLLASGERFLGFAPDMFQLGGDFVVGRQGEMRFAHRMQNHGDRAEVALLIEELRKATLEPAGSGAA